MDSSLTVSLSLNARLVAYQPLYYLLEITALSIVTNFMFYSTWVLSKDKYVVLILSLEIVKSFLNIGGFSVNII